MWIIKQTEEFQEWILECDNKLQDDAIEHINMLKQLGPGLPRPYADTIKGSRITNLKELRFKSREKAIRIFFVFDPERNGILLIGGNKSSSGDKSFYKKMINLCEVIYSKFLDKRKKEIEAEQTKLSKGKKNEKR